MNNDTVKHVPLYVQCILLGGLLYLCFLLQSAPNNMLGIFGVRPALLVALTLCMGLLYGEIAGGVVGFVGGMLMDLYVTPSVNFNAVTLALLGILCGLAINRLFMNNTLSALVLCFVGSFLYFFLYWLLFRVILGDGGAWIYFYSFTLPSAVYTGAFGVVFFPLLRWFRRHA